MQNKKKNFQKILIKDYGSREIAVSITDKISLSEATIGNEEYQSYRKSSVVEEYITSIEPEFRVAALLYFYANLSISEIAKVLKDSEYQISKIIEKSRIKIYEMIKNKEVDL